LTIVRANTTEDRGLKHRSRKAVRDVPASPPLCVPIDRHIRKWPPGTYGRLFVTRRGPGGMYVPTAGRPVTRKCDLNRVAQGPQGRAHAR